MVFQIGAWKSFDDLEECLTLEELFESYKGIIDRDNRNAEAMFGADDSSLPVGDHSGGGSSTAFDQIRNKIKPERGPKDITEVGQITDQSGAKFGIGAGIGYKKV